jgi:hypothetical protein
MKPADVLEEARALRALEEKQVGPRKNEAALGAGAGEGAGGVFGCGIGVPGGDGALLVVAAAGAFRRMRGRYVRGWFGEGGHGSHLPHGVGGGSEILRKRRESGAAAWYLPNQNPKIA